MRADERSRCQTYNRYDVIIIGTGAGGGTLAYTWRRPENGSLSLSAAITSPARKRTGTRRSSTWTPTTTLTNPGSIRTAKISTPTPTTTWAATPSFTVPHLFRLRKEDFGELRHHGGISPAWPLSYGDLEPYYTHAENLYQVHGNRGEDPTEPPANSAYPWPAVSHEPRIQQLSDDFARSGLKPFHVPVGVMLDEKNPHKSRCIRCNTCDGFPCLVGAKADAQVVCVDEAIKHPNVTLLTNSLVKRLETDSSGREVKSVVVQRGRAARRRIRADVVVVSCGAINSAALLLRSANEKHPRGLANSSDVVGRHYMGHTNSVMMAISKCPNPTVFQKTLGVNDFYFGVERLAIPDGPHLLRRQVRRDHAYSRCTGHRPEFHLGNDGQTLA